MRRAILGYALILLVSSPVRALSPDLKISQFYHTGWTAKHGAPTGIQSLAQTSDGYLWLGTAAGLFRFDGARFERVEAARNGRLLSGNLFTVWADPSGGLWIGYRFGGATYMINDQITNYSQREGLPVSTVRNFAKDTLGTMWMATTRGLFRLEAQQWVEASRDWKIPRTYIGAVHLDSAGTLWVFTDTSVYFLRRGSHSFQDTGVRIPDVSLARFLASPDGPDWLLDSRGALQLRLPPLGSPMNETWHGLGNTYREESPGPLIDHGRSLWVPSPQGIHRFRYPESLQSRVTSEGATDIFGKADGLTSEHVFSVLEDREGNLWFGTSGGLDEFREARLVKIALPPGSREFAIAAGDHGAIWVGTLDGGLYKFGDGATGEAIPGAHADTITCAYRDPTGALWIGGRNVVWQSRSGVWTEFRRRPIEPGRDRAAGETQAMVMDSAGALWVSVVRTGVFRVVDGKWTLWGGRSDLPQEPATTLTSDAGGNLWFGYPNSRAARLEGNNVTIFSSSNGLNVGTVLAMDARRRHVWVGGERGLARYDGAGFRGVNGRDGHPFNTVSGIVETANGDVWLNTADGAVHIPATEVQLALTDPEHAVNYDTFNYLDGMPGTPQAIRPQPTIAEGTDGRLWFTTSDGVVWTDPDRVVRNEIKPSVLIQSITADGRLYDTAADLQLPVKTRNLQIAYTAPSLSIPERVQFKYRLDGVDSSWQDVGMRRVAYYTDLGPGHYRFRVVASNNDNVWNELGATIGLVVPPTFVQTQWFLLLCAVVFAVVVWLMFRLRLQQISAAQRGRLEARTVERERIARELHDTFLQGVQGLMLRFQAAMEKIPESQPARRLMGEALKCADDVLAEGRNRVSELRESSIRIHDLPHEMQNRGAELAQTFGSKFYLIVQGRVRPLRSDIAEEMEHIGSEALSNAFRHSGAKRIDAQILYSGDSVSLSIRDEGAGFDVADWHNGSQRRHWGLLGMRERARKIQAQFQVTSRPGQGTNVMLRVPGSIAFEESPDRSRWLSLLLGNG